MKYKATVVCNLYQIEWFYNDYAFQAFFNDLKNYIEIVDEREDTSILFRHYQHQVRDSYHKLNRQGGVDYRKNLIDNRHVIWWGMLEGNRLTDRDKIKISLNGESVELPIKQVIYNAEDQEQSVIYYVDHQVIIENQATESSRLEAIEQWFSMEHNDKSTFDQLSVDHPMTLIQYAYDKYISSYYKPEQMPSPIFEYNQKITYLLYGEPVEEEKTEKPPTAPEPVFVQENIPEQMEKSGCMPVLAAVALALLAILAGWGLTHMF